MRNVTLYSFVCVTEQHYVSIFYTCVYKPMLFRYHIGRLVTSQQNVIFILPSLHFWLQFIFVFIRMRRILCIKNQRFTYRPYTSAENRNVVFFFNRDILFTNLNNSSILLCVFSTLQVFFLIYYHSIMFKLIFQEWTKLVFIGCPE